MSNYTATREGDRVEIKEDGRTIAVANAVDAGTLARVIRNVVPAAEGRAAAGSAAESWASLINRVRIQISKKVAEKYLETTGREADENGMIIGAIVRTGHAAFVADQAEADGDLVILHTPMEPTAGRIAVLASSISHVSFDGE